MLDCILKTGETKIKGNVIDYSISGIEIKYIGGSLPAKIPILVISKRLNINKESLLVWNKYLDERSSLAGLKFL